MKVYEMKWFKSSIYGLHNEVSRFLDSKMLSIWDRGSEQPLTPLAEWAGLENFRLVT